jgi:hypothetical protein
MIFLVTEQLLASQVGLNSMEIVYLATNDILVHNVGFLTCGNYMEDARHGLGAQFVSPPTEQGSVVPLRLGLVSGDAAAAAGL